MLEMGPELERAIRAEGERAWPNECCGILLGTIDPNAATEPGADSVRRRLERIIPVENSREEAEQYHRFEIRSEDLMRAELAARKTGEDVLGFYHSHPDHPAEPSDFDREHALPFYSYVIVSVDRGKAGNLRSWELAPDRAKFLEEEIWR
ncbi:MAG: M67 family metallopeptidase [Treponema sp.]|jgi:proteasome lid subunit RPN8/RPN11|nr:M67 family metallopeptidase [Treponema sp.]